MTQRQQRISLIVHVLAPLSLFGGYASRKYLKTNDREQEVFTTNLRFPAEISGGGWDGNCNFNRLNRSCWVLSSGSVCLEHL